MANSQLHDFRTILDIHPERHGFTCVGTTKRNTRCGQKFISHNDLYTAGNTLNLMNDLNVHDPAFLDQVSPHLQTLADKTLCPRWHRNHHFGNSQNVQTVAKWLSVVRAYHDQVIARPSNRTNSSSLSRSSSTTESSSDDRRPGNVVHSRAVPQPDPVPHDGQPHVPRAIRLGPASPRSRRSVDSTADELEGIRRSIREEANNLLQQTIDLLAFWEEDLTPDEVDEISSELDNFRAAQSRIDRHIRALRTRTLALTTPPASPSPAPSPARSPVASAMRSPFTASPTPSPARSSGAPVIRRPVTENCYICYDGIDHIRDAVWCQHGCGQNVHFECFSTWSRTLTRAGRSVTCAFWYVFYIVWVIL